MEKIIRYNIIVVVGALLLAGTGMVFAADPGAGKQKARICASCHGDNGISTSPEIPNLAGQKEAYLVKSLKDFRSGTRKNPIMASVSASLSDADIENMAAYYSGL